MSRTLVWAPVVAVLLLAATQIVGLGGPTAAAGPAAQGGGGLSVGATAPDFTLADQNRQDVRLSQFRGRPVQVAFYVYAFSPG